MIGRKISHYEILEKLGEGGMGVVYQAQDVKLKRTVALKFLPPALTQDSEANKRFINEAQTASSLDHSNICTIFEIDETEEKQLFICMASYDGETLRDKLRRGPLGVRETVDCALQIAAGLSRAHDAGIVHRDVKPSNLMLTRRGEIKIIDFGLAKLVGQTEITRSGATLGTIAYMAPEQVRGQQVDHRADIWSLGVILYEMLSGRHPFEHTSEATLLYLILNEKPTPITEVCSPLPAGLSAIVHKLLTRKPSQRFQTCDQVLNEFRAVAGLMEHTEDVHSPAYSQPKTALGSTPEPEITESLAVLPFNNTAGDEGMEYLCEGITESLITNLSQISHFKIISRTSVFHYKGGHANLQKVARELGVNKLLLGWVAQRGDNISIGIELVDGVDNCRIWGEQYTRNATDMVQIQREIVEDVSSRLKLELTSKERGQLAKQYKVKNEAYQLYLKGRYHWNKRTSEGFRQSINFYNQAVEKDPSYTLAYTGLSDSYALFGIYGYLPAKDVWPKAKAAALKAMEIDPNMAEAHNAMGAVKSSYEWDWPQAEKEFQHSIALNPNYATAHQWYAGQLWILGRFDEALREIRKAQEIDPLSLQISTDVGRVHYYAGDHELAMREYRKILALDANFFPAHFWLGMALLAKSDFAPAVETLQIALTLSGNYAAVTAGLGYAFGLAGKRAKALETVRDLQNRAKTEYIQPVFLAFIYAGLRDLDLSFQYFAEAFEDRSWWLVYAKVWPFPEEMRNDPRYTELVKKIGLPL